MALDSNKVVWPEDKAPSVTIGVGSVANGGVRVIASDGVVTQFLPATSRWTMTWLVMAILGVVLLVAPLVLLATGATKDALIVVSVSLLLVWLIGSLGFAVLGYIRVPTAIVFDAAHRLIVVNRGKAVVLQLPFDMVRGVRVEVRADENYGDDYNVMVRLPGAALWVHQVSSEREAVGFAHSLAAATGLPDDKQLIRRA